MGGVFDDFELVALGKGTHSSHVADLAAVVDGHDGDDFLAGSEFGFDPALGIGDVEVEIFDLAVDEDGAGAEVTDDFGGGGEGHRGHNDALTGLEADGFEGEVQCGGAGVDGDGVFLRDIGGEVFFELLGSRAGGEPAAFEGGDDFVDFFGADTGFVEGDFHERELRT